LPGLLERGAAFWAALPHQLVSNEGVRTMRWLSLPLAHFLRWRLPEGIRTAILGGRVMLSRAAAGPQADALRLAQWALDLSAAEPEGQAAALLEIEARLRRMTPGETRAVRDASKAGQMSRHIAAHFATLGSIVEVAEQVGLRPNYAMTLFKDAFGVTMLDHLIHYRVAHAQQLLITTDRKVLGRANAGKPFHFCILTSAFIIHPCASPSSAPLPPTPSPKPSVVATTACAPAPWAGRACAGAAPPSSTTIC